MAGDLFVVVAPSGAGKTSLVNAMLAAERDIRLSVSHTTRPPRAGEVDGREYHFVSRAAFEAMIAAGEFLEHADVYGNLYGTSRRWIEDELAGEHDVLLEIDWQGARQIRANAPDCKTVFILPPSVTELERRLRSRATDSDAVIRRRLDQALDDMSHWAEFDFVVVNEALDEAVDGLVAILRGNGAALASTAPDTAERARRILGH